MNSKTTCVLFLFVAIWATSQSAQAANLSVNCDKKDKISGRRRLTCQLV